MERIYIPFAKVEYIVPSVDQHETACRYQTLLMEDRRSFRLHGLPITIGDRAPICTNINMPAGTIEGFLRFIYVRNAFNSKPFDTRSENGNPQNGHRAHEGSSAVLQRTVFMEQCEWNLSLQQQTAMFRLLPTRINM